MYHTAYTFRPLWIVRYSGMDPTGPGLRPSYQLLPPSEMVSRLGLELSYSPNSTLINLSQNQGSSFPNLNVA